MPRALCLAMTFLVLPLGHIYADGPPESGANAALKYWQAFATLPTLTHDEQAKLNQNYLTMPLDARARELVGKADYALKMMRRGAALPRCVWGISYEDGIFVRIPHAEATRALSALACLRARLRFEEGRNAEAIDDLVAAMTLGRHVSLEGGLIAVLFGYSVEHRMIETLARYLPKLDARTVQGLKTRVDALPPFGGPAAALRTCEKETLDWFIREVKAAKDEERLLTLLGFVTVSEGNKRDVRGAARAFLRECGGTKEGVLKYAEEARPAYDLLAKKLELPPEQFEKEYEREAKKRAGNPVFKVFFPALVKCRQSQARADVRRALLSAALAVRLDGPGALRKHPDPVGGGPFEYSPFEGGFELRSKFKVEDKPLSLTVGRQGK
jgi:hypothetical protein